jgi:hypothetical protein
MSPTAGAIGELANIGRHNSAYSQSLKEFYGMCDEAAQAPARDRWFRPAEATSSSTDNPPAVIKVDGKIVKVTVTPVSNENGEIGGYMVIVEFEKVATQDDGSTKTTTGHLEK